MSTPITGFYRTPDSCFDDLHDFPYTPHYRVIDGIRIAYIDEGPKDGETVLLMHGEPTWSYLYRKMIPVLVQAGYRVLAPDLVGFGRSDKPLQRNTLSYRQHVAWMSAWLNNTPSTPITLFCQDWGSLIGLRMIHQLPDRFARVSIGNGGLPTGTGPVPKAFHIWQNFAKWSPIFPIGKIVSTGCAQGLPPHSIAAYNSPFPERKAKLAARMFPSFVPTKPTDPERQNNESAWAFFEQWHKPFITFFSSRDPITRGGDKIFQQRVPGAKNQSHQTVRGAGHFLQEDKGEELAQLITQFIRNNPILSTP